MDCSHGTLRDACQCRVSSAHHLDVPHNNLAMFAVQLWVSNVFVDVDSMSTRRQGLQLLPLQPYSCIGSTCVTAGGGAIAIGMRMAAAGHFIIGCCHSATLVHFLQLQLLEVAKHAT